MFFITMKSMFKILFRLGLVFTIWLNRQSLEYLNNTHFRDVDKATATTTDVSTAAPDIPSIMHVFQFGPSRTATTTQFNMVSVALFLHIQMYHPHLLNNIVPVFAPKNEQNFSFYKNVPHVIKSHIAEIEPRLFRGYPEIFSSTFSKKEAAEKKEKLIKQGFKVGLIQDMETLREVGAKGMVKQYIDFFSLKGEHIRLMEDYFELWGKLRQCCGLQMSKNYRNELLPVSDKEKIKPHEFCSSIDLDQLEAQFMNTTLYSLLNRHSVMKKINRPAMVDGDLNGTYCSRYSAAVQKHGLQGRKSGLNMRYREVEHNCMHNSTSFQPWRCFILPEK